MNANLAGFTEAEMIETIVLACLQGGPATEGRFGTGELVPGGFAFETVTGLKGKAWTTASMGEGGAWMVELAGKAAVGPDYLLEAAHVAVKNFTLGC